MANIYYWQVRINITSRWILRAIKEILKNKTHKLIETSKVVFFLFWHRASIELYDFLPFYEYPLKREARWPHG